VRCPIAVRRDGKVSREYSEESGESEDGSPCQHRIDEVQFCSTAVRSFVQAANQEGFPPFNPHSRLVRDSVQRVLSEVLGLARLKSPFVPHFG
jgi:hypothetical protein